MMYLGLWTLILWKSIMYDVFHPIKINWIKFGQEIFFAYTAPKTHACSQWLNKLIFQTLLQENPFFLNEVLKELILFVISMK